MQNEEVVLATFLDITDRKQAEAELRRSEAELAKAQRVANVGSWRWDAVTGVTTGCDELYRIYGLDPARSQSPDFQDQAGTLYPDAAWQRLHRHGTFSAWDRRSRRTCLLPPERACGNFLSAPFLFRSLRAILPLARSVSLPRIMLYPTTDVAQENSREIYTLPFVKIIPASNLSPSQSRPCRSATREPRFRTRAAARGLWDAGSAPCRECLPRLDRTRDGLAPLW